jgi:hypothetical protein
VDVIADIDVVRSMGWGGVVARVSPPALTASTAAAAVEWLVMAYVGVLDTEAGEPADKDVDDDHDAALSLSSRSFVSFSCCLRRSCSNSCCSRSKLAQ